VLQPVRNGLRSLYLILTASAAGEDLRDSSIFKWADDKGRTETWIADEDLVTQLIVGAGKYQLCFADLTKELSLHFADAFQGRNRSADLKLVHKFLASSNNTIGEWWKEQSRAVGISAPSSEAITQIRALAQAELSYVEEECRRISGKSLSQIFVSRSFVDWNEQTDDNTPFAISDTPANLQTWNDVSEIIGELGTVVILGDAGFGKTVCLLREVQQNLLSVEKAVETQPLAVTELKFAFYFYGPELAEHCTGPSNSLIEAALQVLERRTSYSHHLRTLLSEKFESGQVLLAIDGLDEVPERVESGIASVNPFDALITKIRTLRRTTHPCAILLTSRRLGWRLSLIPGAIELELLRFGDGALTYAVANWFKDAPECLKSFQRMLRDVPPLNELLRIPILFSIAARLFEEHWQREKKFPIFRRRTDLYQAWLKHLDQRLVERMSGANALGVSQREEFWPFVEEVGWNLWKDNPASSNFSGPEINRAISKLSISSALSSRRDLLGDIRESGVLTKSGPSPISTPYTFLHRTLLEYLASRHLAVEMDHTRQDAAVWGDVTGYLNDKRRWAVLWMLSASLRTPGVLLRRLVDLCTIEQAGSVEFTPDFAPAELTELIADCLLECTQGLFKDAVLPRAWNEMVAGLYSLQKQSGIGLGAWNRRAQWSLVEKVLGATRLQATKILGIQAVAGLLSDLRCAQVKVSKGGRLPPNVVTNIGPRIQLAIEDECPVARWAAIWAVCAFHRAGRPEISAQFKDRVVSHLKDDENAHVRATAAEAVAEIRHPDAYSLLRAALGSECHTAAAGAATGLCRLGEVDAVETLRLKAAQLLSNPGTRVPGDPLLESVIRALGGLLNNQKNLSFDPRIKEILLHTLNDPYASVRGAAAAVIGRVGLTEAWEPVTKLLGSAPGLDTSLQRMRASASHACIYLVKKIPFAKLGNAADLFHSILKNSSESPELRSNAASVLGEICRRGYTRPDGVIERDLLEGSVESDLAVAKSCLMTVVDIGSAPEEIFSLLSQYESSRLLLSGLSIPPGDFGFRLLYWLLDTTEQPEIVTRSLNTLRRCVKSIEKEPADYFSKHRHELEELCQRCFALLESSHWPRVLSSALASILQIISLRECPSQTRKEFRPKLLRNSRMLLNHTSSRVQTAACTVLATIGDQSDIRVLEPLTSHPNARIAKVAQNACQKLRTLR